MDKSTEWPETLITSPRGYVSPNKKIASSYCSKWAKVYTTSEMRLPVGEKYLRYRIKSTYSENKRREFHFGKNAYFSLFLNIRSIGPSLGVYFMFSSDCCTDC